MVQIIKTKEDYCLDCRGNDSSKDHYRIFVGNYSISLCEDCLKKLKEEVDKHAGKEL